MPDFIVVFTSKKEQYIKQTNKKRDYNGRPSINIGLKGEKLRESETDKDLRDKDEVRTKKYDIIVRESKEKTVRDLAA